MTDLPTFGNPDPNAPLYGPETIDPLTGVSSTPSPESKETKSPFNEILDKANEQHRSYGSTALYIFVNSSSFKQAYDSFSKGPSPDEWVARLLSSR